MKSKQAKRVIYTSLLVIYFSFLARVLYKVVNDEGLDTYNSVSLVQWNYISVLVLLLLIPVALLIGYFISKYLTLRENRKWEKVKNEIRENT